MGGLYIHIPFCKSKCIYCDFYSVGSKNAPWNTFVSSILNELTIRLNELPTNISTIYIGGGTPSQMPNDILKYLINNIKSLCGDKWNIKEFTIEVNPEDVTNEYVETLLSIGVNRVSMGIQSLNDNELKLLNRRHSSEQAINAFNLLSRIPNKSVDLIFGLPNQSINSWISIIEKILDLRPNHISAYSLMFEEGTAIYLMRQQGRIKEADENVSNEMFNILLNRLKQVGYVQYEISNFALPGYESIHNTNYWKGISYLGLGPSAHSYDGHKIRKCNPSSYKKYIDFYMSEKKHIESFYNEEILSDEELFEEYVITRMRMKGGIDISDLKTKFGDFRLNQFTSNAEKYIKSGKIIKSDSHYALSEEGIMISDMIFVDLI